MNELAERTIERARQYVALEAAAAMMLAVRKEDGKYTIAVAVGPWIADQQSAEWICRAANDAIQARRSEMEAILDKEDAPA